MGKTFVGVEIARVGKFDAMTGPVEFTTQDFDNAASAWRSLRSALHPVIKLGHNDKQSMLAVDGLPNAGFLSNIRRSGDRLLADFVDVPDQVAELITSRRLNARSVEALRNARVNGKRWPFVITGLALLGADLPAVDSLKDLTALYASQGLEVPANKDYGGSVVLAAFISATAMPSHKTPTDDGSWDAGMMEKRCSQDAASLKKLYAWTDPEGDPDVKASYKFPHHMVSGSGEVGAASTVACSAGIAILNGSRGGADIPDSDRQGVYRHLAGHLTDADREPPELAARGDENVDELADVEDLIAQLKELLTKAEGHIHKRGGAPKFRVLVRSAVDELRSIHQRNKAKESQVDTKKVAAALGLEETATEEEIMAALAKVKKDGGSDDDDPKDKKSKVKAGKKSGDDDGDEDEEANTLRAELAETQRQVVELTTARAKDQAERDVDTAIKAGKFAPASRTTLIKMAVRAPKEFTDLAKATPDNAVFARGEKGSDGDGVELSELEPSEAEKVVMASTGVSRDEFIEARARELGKQVPKDVADRLAASRAKR